MPKVLGLVLRQPSHLTENVVEPADRRDRLQIEDRFGLCKNIRQRKDDMQAEIMLIEVCWCNTGDACLYNV